MATVTASYPSPRALLEKYGLRAKKSWGQNFLGDDGILSDIARLAAPRAGDPVVELGAEVTLVEADAARLEYAALARQSAGGSSTSTSTTTATSTTTTTGGGKIAVVGNLPYHLTSPILFSVLDQVEAVSRAVFLVQREVAERLAAAPGTHDWGILSVLLQREADVSIERIVPPGAFLPPPKVESAVLCALFRPPADAVADPVRFRRLVKAGFAQRRKTLGNALKAARLVPPDALAAALAAAGIDPGRRGETLTVAEWAALDRALG